jgi:16S rRNA G966 N2-methylase RsmD
MAVIVGFDQIPKHTYQIIYADPPWEVDGGSWTISELLKGENWFCQKKGLSLVSTAKNMQSFRKASRIS